MMLSLTQNILLETLQEDIIMIWLPHKKYTSEHIADRLNEICTKVRQETRRMVYVASVAASVMAFAHMSYIYGL